jgi:hypothetical protein
MGASITMVLIAKIQISCFDCVSIRFQRTRRRIDPRARCTSGSHFPSDRLFHRT